MKLNRFAALALIAIIAVATMSFFGMRALAQTPTPAAPAQDCDSEDDDAYEAADDGEDLDDVEEECGPQDEQEGDVEEVEDKAEGPDVAITGTPLEQASAAALAYLGEGRVTGTEIGDEEGYYEIEVTLADGHQVDVHLDENFNVLGQLEDND